MARIKAEAAGGAGGGGASTLNLSATTKTDTGSMQGGSTSLGTSSTIGLAAGVHGKWDAGMDGYALLVALPVVPTQGKTLRVVMTCSGATGDPGYSAASISIMLTTGTTPASTQGYFASGMQRDSGGSLNKVVTPDRLGDNFAGTTTLSGTMTAIAEFPWGASNPLSCNTTSFGSTGGEVYVANKSGNSGTWTAPCLGVCMQNSNTSTGGGATEVVWSDVVITYEILG
jgi:hypothetical protein